MVWEVELHGNIFRFGLCQLADHAVLSGSQDPLKSLDFFSLEKSQSSTYHSEQMIHPDTKP